MPYCVECRAWFPRSEVECGACGGALADERPPSVRVLDNASAAIEDVGASVDTHGHFPDPEAESLDPQEAARLARAFDAVRERARGRHAAPSSWLPASGRRVATALLIVHQQTGDEGDWPRMRAAREALVDLQAFVPDDEVAASEAWVRPRTGAPGYDPWELEPIRRAQANVISWLREDDMVLGAYNALADVDVVIGEARRSLEAVDRYKTTQSLGFAAMFYWPIGLLIGLVLGTLMTGLSAVAIVIVIAVASAGYHVLFLAPAFGIAVGTLTSRLDRLAMRADRPVPVLVGRAVTDVVGAILFLGVPVVIGVVIALVCRHLGVP